MKYLALGFAGLALIAYVASASVNGYLDHSLSSAFSQLRVTP